VGIWDENGTTEADINRLMVFLLKVAIMKNGRYCKTENRKKMPIYIFNGIFGGD